MTKEDIMQAIENMTVLELAELVKALEEKFGVSAAAPVAMAMPVAAAQLLKPKRRRLNLTLSSYPPVRRRLELSRLSAS